MRLHSVVYTADNVLTPSVIQTIYKQRKLLNQVTIGSKSFDVSFINSVSCPYQLNHALGPVYQSTHSQIP